ncbi:MAG TPA: nicotinate (nicotinamide) nucleotide adenylyltransferase [Thermoanaerobaculia bacterium]|jgi:nicotinate-nucleotide adenylyltransferase|nr:nicotinate (nicotinamide) nucleotide adenylyltransferase [Thermoanaerobaculia bacterium]
MKIGLFGGSFDPIHAGHVETVRAARQALGLERVIYLPTAQPPHKPGRRLAPALARYAMVELALLAEEGLYASPFELTFGRPAYTIDSLEHFRRIYPDAEIHLLIGADSFLELEAWWRWREIVEAAHLIVLARPGAELVPEALSPALAELLDSGRARVLAQRTVDLSSTELRESLGRSEEPPVAALSPLVLDYVRKYSLYR